MLFTMPMIAAAALVAAFVIAFVHKSLLAFLQPDVDAADNDGLAVAFRGPAPSQDEMQGKSLYTIIGIGLIAIIALFDVMLAGPALRSAARLLGFSPLVTTWNLPNVVVLVSLLTVALLWVQLGHFVQLRSIWTRCRFVGLIVSAPLLLRTALWLGIGLAVRHGVLPDHQVSLAGYLAAFLAMAVVPFAAPALHARLFGPLSTSIRGRLPTGLRHAAEYLGNALLFLGVIAIVATSGFVRQPVSNSGIFAHSSSLPMPNGMPHICMNDYPPEAQRAGEQGDTVVSFTVTSAGLVKNVAVVHSSGSLRLDAAAVECVTRWTYVPASEHGRPVDKRWAAKVAWRLR